MDGETKCEIDRLVVKRAMECLDEQAARPCPNPLARALIPYRPQPADLDALIARATAAFDAMTPEEQAAHRKAQRESWVRGEMGMGSDADEARERALLRSRGEDGHGR